MAEKRVLVQYDSESDDGHTATAEEAAVEAEAKPPSPPSKKRKLPDLSSSLALPVPKDDPALHQGRIRSKPHVNGQYASFVYALVELDEGGTDLLSEITEYVLKKVPEASPMSNPQEKLHISVSRTIYLRDHQRDALKQSVKSIANNSRQSHVSFSSFAALTNDEQTRTFLTLEIGAGHTELTGVASSLETFLSSIRQAAYYDQPRFHASFAWALLNRETPSPWPKDLIPNLEAEFGQRLRSCMSFRLLQLETKIGKDISSIKLAE